MLAERCPNLAHSYEETINKIKTRGTVWIKGTDGLWFHSSNPEHVERAIKRIKSVLKDEGYEERHNYEAFLQ